MSDTESDTGRAAYLTTARTGPRIAGRPVTPGQAGQRLMLTRDEAAFDRAEGSLVREGEDEPTVFGTVSEALIDLQAGIAAEVARYAAARAGTPRATAPEPEATAAEPQAEPASAEPSNATAEPAAKPARTSSRAA